MRNTVIFIASLLIFSFISCQGKEVDNKQSTIEEKITIPDVQLTHNQDETPTTVQEAADEQMLEAESPKEQTKSELKDVQKEPLELKEIPVKEPKTTQTSVENTPQETKEETEVKVIKTPETEEVKKEPIEEEAVKETLSHDAWDKLLKKYVSPSGKVNYKGFKSEMSSFQAYLDLLVANPPKADWSRNKIRAYWINAYNAFTVKTILDNYPLKSITNLGKPWDKKFIKIGGSTYSLNDIEHNILRAKYFDSRIHFAVNCASFSCPKLLNKAFTEANVSAQMGSLASIYINDSRHNKITPEKAELSQIFEWYKGDFTKKGSLIDYINKYSKVKLNPDAEITFKAYNWNLNE
ncbi:MAG: DUF547 domain-containing protein [Bacteroidia bacterium]|nr:DUF547 domain-containing protein [Bacteroidia bacterium]